MAKQKGSASAVIQALASLGSSKAQQQGAPAVTVSDKAREFAASILQAGLFLEEFKADMFGLVREAVVAGCSFEEMEQAEPDLRKLQSYRSAKSAIANAKKEGISLFDAEGNPKGRTALEKETKEKRAANVGEDANASTTSDKGANGKKYAYGDVHSFLVAAFAVLKTEPSMRKAYRVEIREIARMTANDEASTAPTDKPNTLNVSPRRARVAAAAAKLAQTQGAAALEQVVAQATGTNG